MTKGLETFLKMIRQDPSNETLVERFLALLEDEDPANRLPYYQELFNFLITFKPKFALEIAFLELKLTRSLGDLNAEIDTLTRIERCFHVLNRPGKAEVVRNEMETLKQNLDFPQINPNETDLQSLNRTKTTTDRRQVEQTDVMPSFAHSLAIPDFQEEKNEGTANQLPQVEEDSVEFSVPPLPDIENPFSSKFVFEDSNQELKPESEAVSPEVNPSIHDDQSMIEMEDPEPLEVQAPFHSPFKVPSFLDLDQKLEREDQLEEPEIQDDLFASYDQFDWNHFFYRFMEYLSDFGDQRANQFDNWSRQMKLRPLKTAQRDIIIKLLEAFEESDHDVTIERLQFLSFLLLHLEPANFARFLQELSLTYDFEILWSEVIKTCLTLNWPRRSHILIQKACEHGFFYREPEVLYDYLRQVHLALGWQLTSWQSEDGYSKLSDIIKQRPRPQLHKLWVGRDI